MNNEVTVSAQIDQITFDQVSDLISPLGLSAADTIQLLLARLARGTLLPSGLELPNADTLAAMRELEEGKAQRFATADELFADLGI